ncbi:MAG: hypothetical protein FWF29_07460 [Treponema sp.]|nr:hypothetical protein [Treponema sp.]
MTAIAGMEYYQTVDSKTFLSKLSKYLFWDCNIAEINPKRDINLVLERVFSQGTENDEKEIFRYYNLKNIKDSVVSINYLDRKTLNYLSIILNVPKEEFKCCKKSLLESPFGIS